jgi:hypothetical protein
MLKLGGYFLIWEPCAGSLIDIMRKLWYKMDKKFFQENEASIDARKLASHFSDKMILKRIWHSGSFAYFFVLSSMHFSIKSPPVLLMSLCFWSRHSTKYNRHFYQAGYYVYSRKTIKDAHAQYCISHALSCIADTIWNSGNGHIMNTKPSRREIFWNYSSTAIIGLSGILLLLVVGSWYGAAALGVFNKIFALYIVFSQIAAFGVHLSVLKYAAEENGKENGNQYVLLGALTVLVPIAACVMALMCASAPLVAYSMRSLDMEHGMYWAAGAVFFFACNKTLLALLNAHMRLREYAFYGDFHN